MARAGAKNGIGKEQRREIFISAYLANGGDGQQAAITAGFAKSGAASAANRMLHEKDVIERITALKQALLTKHNMTAESVMKQLAAIVHFDFRKLFDSNGKMKDISELDDDTASALSSIEVDLDMDGKTVKGLTKKVKIFDKNQAITNAMKHYKLLTDGGVTVNAGLVVISSEDAKLV